jgi:transposase-like protein
MVAAANGRRKVGKFFAIVVPDRSAATLIPIIRQMIKKDSIIVSDGWAAYHGIMNEPGFAAHYVVNHSLHYVDPDTGMHTNACEGNWNGLKRKIPRQGFRDDVILQEYLAEMMWRKANSGMLMGAAMELLRDYVKEE